MSLLSVPQTRVKCYKIPPDNDLCLCEDIFQEHQAKLINCDSEDANAINLRKMTTSQSMPAGTSFMSAANADVIRRKKDIDSDVMSTKFNWKNSSLDDVKLSNSRRLDGWIPIPGMKKYRSDIYLSKSGQWEMSIESKPSPVHDYVVKEGLSKEHSASYDAIIERIIVSSSSTSSSESICGNPSVSPNMTSSSSSVDEQNKSVKSSICQKDNLNTSDDKINSNKLTSEECVKVLKELDEMASGSFLKKINEFGSQDLIKEPSKQKNEMTDFLTSMLKLDLSGLKDSSSDSDQNRVGKNDSSEDEILQFGCGRVAALARHFSGMGERGIIRGSGRPKTKMRNMYRSEPDISSLEDKWNIPDSTTFTTGDKRFKMILTGVGIHPVGFSMDRLLDIGQGSVVLKEVTDEKDCCISNKNEETISNSEFTEVVGSNQTESEVPDESVPTHSVLDNEISCFPSPLVDIDNKPLSKIYEVSESECNTPTETNEKMFFSECPFVKNFRTESGLKSSSFDSYSNYEKNDGIINLNKKAISVDEIDLRRIKKHGSLIDLGRMRTISDSVCSDSSTADIGIGRTSDMISEHGKSKLESFKKFSGRFCSSDEINKTFSGIKNDTPYLGDIKRWTSVDSYGVRATKDNNECYSPRFSNYSKSEDKGSLRRIQRLDAIKSRKLRKSKRLDSYRSFVLTPVRHSEAMKSGGSDRYFSLSTDSSDSSTTWWKRRSSVPEERSPVDPECQPSSRKL